MERYLALSWISSYTGCWSNGQLVSTAIGTNPTPMPGDQGVYHLSTVRFNYVLGWTASWHISMQQCQCFAPFFINRWKARPYPDRINCSVAGFSLIIRLFANADGFLEDKQNTLSKSSFIADVRYVRRRRYLNYITAVRRKSPDNLLENASIYLIVTG